MTPPNDEQSVRETCTAELRENPNVIVLVAEPVPPTELPTHAPTDAITASLRRLPSDPVDEVQVPPPDKSLPEVVYIPAEEAEEAEEAESEEVTESTPDAMEA